MAMADRVTVDVAVRGLAAGGSGVASLPDGRVVFVPRTAPGDHARVVVEKEKKRWAAASLVELVERGTSRREPMCSIYDRCGGCQLQHVEYDEQLRWKGRFVSDALSRIAGLEELTPPDVTPSPLRLRYRSRMSFTLRRLRNGRVVAGLHEAGRPGRIVDVAGQCLLPETAVIEAWQELRSAWGPGARALPDGGSLRLTVRATPAGTELLVEGGRAGWDPEPLAAACPALKRVFHQPTRREPRQGGSDALPEVIAWPDDDALEGLGSAFEQVNPVAAALVHGRVLEAADGDGAVVDAYCGLGGYGRALAESGRPVVGIEVDPTATRLAEAGAPPSFRVVTGSVEAQLGAQLPADVVVLNPPRTGIAPEVAEALLATPPRRIVYVSCDPATLARDVRALIDAYALSDVSAYDLFPQTAHVESVAVLDRREVQP